MRLDVVKEGLGSRTAQDPLKVKRLGQSTDGREQEAWSPRCLTTVLPRNVCVCL